MLVEFDHFHLLARRGFGKSPIFRNVFFLNMQKYRKFVFQKNFKKGINHVKSRKPQDHVF